MTGRRRQTFKTCFSSANCHSAWMSLLLSLYLLSKKKITPLKKKKLIVKIKKCNNCRPLLTIKTGQPLYWWSGTPTNTLRCFYERRSWHCKVEVIFPLHWCLHRHEGKGLVPAWHLINCSWIFISLNQSCGRSGVITSWVWKQSHLVLPTVLDLWREKQPGMVEEVWKDYVKRRCSWKKRAYFPPPALSLLFANTRRKMEYIRIQAWQPWQTICFSFLKFHGGKKTCCLRVCNINNHDL